MLNESLSRYIISLQVCSSQKNRKHSNVKEFVKKNNYTYTFEYYTVLYISIPIYKINMRIYIS